MAGYNADTMLFGKLAYALENYPTDYIYCRGPIVTRGVRKRFLGLFCLRIIRWNWLIPPGLLNTR